MKRLSIALAIGFATPSAFADEPDLVPTTPPPTVGQVEDEPEPEAVPVIDEDEMEDRPTQDARRSKFRTSSNGQRFRVRRKRGNRVCTMGGGCRPMIGDDVEVVIQKRTPKKVCESKRAEKIEVSEGENVFPLQFTVVESQLEGAEETDPSFMRGHLIKTRCVVETSQGEEDILLPGGRFPDGAFDAACETPRICRPGRTYVAKVFVDDNGAMWVVSKEDAADVSSCGGEQ